jgi:hypothetical protein
MLFVVFASASRVLFASDEEVRIVGSVVDYVTKLPVPGIYIAVKGMGKGVITNDKGKFVLRIPRSVQESNLVLEAVSKNGSETLSPTKIPDMAVMVKGAGVEVRMYRYPVYYPNPIKIQAYFHKYTSDSQLMSYSMNVKRIGSDSLHGVPGAGELSLIKEKHFAAESKLEEEKDSVMKTTLLTIQAQIKTVQAKTRKVYGHNYRFPSTEGYTRFFSIYTQYPDSARKLHLEGAVVLQFQVDEKGVPSGFTFMSSPHPVFETELLRCAPTMPKCVPAHYHKRPTKTIVNQTIFFELIDL